MGKALGLLVAKLPPTYQAMLTIVGAIGVGCGVTLAALGFLQLPAKVSAQEIQIRSLGDEVVNLYEEAARSRRADSTMTADLGRILCLVEADALGESSIQRCGLR